MTSNCRNDFYQAPDVQAGCKESLESDYLAINGILKFLMQAPDTQALFAG